MRRIGKSMGGILGRGGEARGRLVISCFDRGEIKGVVDVFRSLLIVLGMYGLLVFFNMLNVLNAFERHHLSNCCLFWFRS